MKKEELLKGISDLLKKHENYLNSNPEVFHAIENRLFKAIDYGNWEGEDNQDKYDDEEDYSGQGYGDDLFDRIPDEDNEEGFQDSQDSEELDDADKWLAENESSTSSETGDNLDADEVGSVQQEVQEEPKPEPQKRSSRYLDWKPQDKYEDKHQAVMDKHMTDGYSHREAERMAGAHKAPNDFYSALKHTTNPSEPSPKMLEQMKSLSHEWLRNANRKGDEAAEAEVNPIKHASGKTIAAHEAAHGEFADAHNAFINSDEVKALKGRDRHNAVKAFKADWHEKNPEHRDKAIAAADSGKVLQDATEARNKARTEGSQALLEAGMSSGKSGNGGYSDTAAGFSGEMSDQQAAQMIGGEQTEGGYNANIKKDPSAVFAERNPEYIKHLKGKLEGKLNPQQTQRMAGIDSFKNKGNK